MQKQLLTRAGSYVSQHEAVVSFGLGVASQVDLVTIVWPGGKEQKLENVKVNQRLVIHESD